MMKIFFTAFLLVCCRILLHGQPFPVSYEIKSDTIEWQEISPDYWQLLEDKTGTLKIADIQSDAISRQFRSGTVNGEFTGLSTNTYWFRYRLKNVMATDAKIALNSLSEYDDFY